MYSTKKPKTDLSDLHYEADNMLSFNTDSIAFFKVLVFLNWRQMVGTLGDNKKNSITKT